MKSCTSLSREGCNTFFCFLCVSFESEVSLLAKMLLQCYLFLLFPAASYPILGFNTPSPEFSKPHARQSFPQQAQNEPQFHSHNYVTSAEEERDECGGLPLSSMFEVFCN